jgi:hypothetical protein
MSIDSVRVVEDEVETIPTLPQSANVSDLDRDTESLEQRFQVADEEESERLPWKQIIPLCLLQVVESFNSSGIYSYLTFIVLDFRPELDRDTAGRLAGWVASSVYCGAFLSSYAWGRLSDKVQL